MKIGDTIHLKALGSATKRTKNRIHNRGKSGFEVTKLPQRTNFVNGTSGDRDWIMLDSLDSLWSGWLAMDEIEVINESR